MAGVRFAFSVFVRSVVLALPACTLSTDPFEPTLIDPAESGEAPLEPGPPIVAEPAPESNGGAGNQPVSDGPDEGGSGSVPLDPTGSDDPTDSEVDGAEQEDGTGGTGSVGGEDTPPDEPTPDSGKPTTPPVVPCFGSTFEASCYEFFAERVSWTDARAACVTWGGQLASVASFEQDSFIGIWPAQLGLASGDGTGIWLGATDEFQENDFRWPDNTPLTFASWAPNQPDNGAGLDCIEKRNDGTALWYDRRCTDLNPYVCERGL